MSNLDRGLLVETLVSNVDDLLFVGESLSYEVRKEVSRKIYQLFASRDDLGIFILSSLDSLEAFIESFLSNHVLLDFVYGYLIGRWDVYGRPLD